jgi:ubiquinone/menaquinone biosynthesis C-methylase UbiE
MGGVFYMLELQAAPTRRWSPLAAWRRLVDAGYWFDPRDIGLFLTGAATDAWIRRLRGSAGHRTAFETVYRETADPWASVTKRYRYQTRKYEVVMSLLPKGRRFQSALDLGCGLGPLSRRIAERADKVLGLDVAQSAIDRAQQAHGHLPGVSFSQADVLALPDELDGRFDLVVIADTLYYLPSTDEALLNQLAERISRLLMPGGLCVLVNHFFFSKDPESALSKRIHRAFEQVQCLCNPVTHWRPFYITTFLDKVPAPAE